MEIPHASGLTNPYAAPGAPPGTRTAARAAAVAAGAAGVAVLTAGIAAADETDDPFGSGSDFGLTSDVDLFPSHAFGSSGSGPADVSAFLPPDPAPTAPEPVFTAPSEPVFSVSSEPTFSVSSEPAFSLSSEPTFSISSEPAFAAPAEPTFSVSSEPAFPVPSEPGPVDADPPPDSRPGDSVFAGEGSDAGPGLGGDGVVASLPPAPADDADPLDDEGREILVDIDESLLRAPAADAPPVPVEPVSGPRPDMIDELVTVLGTESPGGLGYLASYGVIPGDVTTLPDDLRPGAALEPPTGEQRRQQADQPEQQSRPDDRPVAEEPPASVFDHATVISAEVEREIVAGGDGTETLRRYGVSMPVGSGFAEARNAVGSAARNAASTGTGTEPVGAAAAEERRRDRQVETARQQRIQADQQAAQQADQQAQQLQQVQQSPQQQPQETGATPEESLVPIDEPLTRPSWTSATRRAVPIDSATQIRAHEIPLMPVLSTWYTEAINAMGPEDAARYLSEQFGIDPDDPRFTTFRDAAQYGLGAIGNDTRNVTPSPRVEEENLTRQQNAFRNGNAPNGTDERRLDRVNREREAAGLDPLPPTNAPTDGPFGVNARTVALSDEEFAQLMDDSAAVREIRDAIREFNIGVGNLADPDALPQDVLDRLPAVVDRTTAELARGTLTPYFEQARRSATDDGSTATGQDGGSPAAPAAESAAPQQTTTQQTTTPQPAASAGDTGAPRNQAAPPAAAVPSRQSPFQDPATLDREDFRISTTTIPFRADRFDPRAPVDPMTPFGAPRPTETAPDDPPGFTPLRTEPVDLPTTPPRLTPPTGPARPTPGEDAEAPAATRSYPLQGTGRAGERRGRYEVTPTDTGTRIAVQSSTWTDPATGRTHRTTPYWNGQQVTGDNRAATTTDRTVALPRGASTTPSGSSTEVLQTERRVVPLSTGASGSRDGSVVIEPVARDRRLSRVTVTPTETRVPVDGGEQVVRTALVPENRTFTGRAESYEVYADVPLREVRTTEFVPTPVRPAAVTATVGATSTASTAGGADRSAAMRQVGSDVAAVTSRPFAPVGERDYTVTGHTGAGGRPALTVQGDGFGGLYYDDGTLVPGSGRGDAPSRLDRTRLRGKYVEQLFGTGEVPMGGRGGAVRVPVRVVPSVTRPSTATTTQPAGTSTYPRASEAWRQRVGTGGSVPVRQGTGGRGVSPR